MSENAKPQPWKLSYVKQHWADFAHGVDILASPETGKPVEVIGHVKLYGEDAERAMHARMIEALPLLVHAVGKAMDYLEYVPETEVEESQAAFLACEEAIRYVQGVKP